MGILNVTPDSFYDGGRYCDIEGALARGLEMIAQGADIIDVGGESTRPGAVDVPIEDEIARVVGVVARLSREIRVSVDTVKPEVAAAALEAGATIINDVSASLEAVAGDYGAGWVAMHMRGRPSTMQTMTDYDDVVGEVRGYLSDAVERGKKCGVTEIWVDPGIGFAKTADQNFELLACLDQVVADGTPVLVGVSRKSFLGNIPGGPYGPDDRLEASLAAAVWCVDAGAAVVRVHDVLETVQALKLLVNSPVKC